MAMGFKLLLMGLFCLANQSGFSQQNSLQIAQKAEAKAWRKTMPNILQKIQPPKFRRDTLFLFPAADDASQAFRQKGERQPFNWLVNQTIEAMSGRGGGVVCLTPGNYQSHGPIILKNNVNLHLKAGAHLRFSANPHHYLPVVKVRWEGTVCYNYQPLIRANGATNIALTGAGKIDGGADEGWHLWKKQADGNDQEKDKKILRDMGRDGLPESQRLFGKDHKLRPSLIEFFECKNILIEGLTLRQSPFWTVHPVFSRNITIRRLKIEPGTTNDDGIDPDGCQFVLIEDCEIDTDDDPISLKAGRDNDAWNRPGTANIVVRNIKGRSRVGNGFCIGSEMSGGVENVFVENVQISRADNGLNIKSNLDRGGFVRNIFVRNVSLDTAAKQGILMQKDYHSYRGGKHPPKYSGIHFSNIKIGVVQKGGMRLAGVAEQAIEKVFLNNVQLGSQGKANEFIHLKDCWLNGQPLQP